MHRSETKATASESLHGRSWSRGQTSRQKVSETSGSVSRQELTVSCFSKALHHRQPTLATQGKISEPQLKPSARHSPQLPGDKNVEQEL